MKEAASRGGLRCLNDHIKFFELPGLFGQFETNALKFVGYVLVFALGGELLTLYRQLPKLLCNSVGHGYAFRKVGHPHAED